MITIIKMDKIGRNERRNVEKRNKTGKLCGTVNIVKAGKKGFSLIEIVFTIIIIGLAMGAITESFIAGSAKSVNIVNEETAMNIAKQTIAAINYCRDGGTPISEVCSAWTTSTPTPPVSPWITTTLPSTLTQVVSGSINNECFNTVATAYNGNFEDSNGTIGTNNAGNPITSIQVIVQTGWFSANGGAACPAAPTGCPGTPGSCPYVTLSTVFAHY